MGEDWPLDKLEFANAFLSPGSCKSIFERYFQFANLLSDYENLFLQHFSKLKSITELVFFTGTPLTQDDMKFLSPLVNLKKLIFKSLEIGNGLKWLQYCKELEYLSVSSNNIGDGAVIDLFSNEFNKLYNLDLSSNLITNYSCEIISRMNHLEELNISHNSNIGDEFSLLGKLDNVILHANGCGITDLGIVGYLNSPPKSTSKKRELVLYIEYNQFTDETLQALIDYAKDGIISEVIISDSEKFNSNLKRKLSKLSVEFFSTCSLALPESDVVEQQSNCSLQ